MRIKEQEYVKKSALQEQKIELLEIQLKETEEREANQKKLYDRMFQALDDANNNMNQSSNALAQISAPNSARSHRDRDIEILNRQYQEQMAERVKELELQVMTKEQEIAQFRINEIQV